MSAYGEITLPWADGDYVFRLGFKEISQFEERFDRSFLAFIGRVANGEAKFQELREIIRLGLIGGGMDALAALKLVKEYVEERPPSENLTTAILVARAGAFGSPKDAKKKISPKKGRTKSMNASTSSNSSEAPAQSE